MATPDNVMAELLNNNDVVVIYDGAVGFPEAGRRTGSLRYATFKLIWDLLRFQKPADFKWPTVDVTKAVGMRDQVSRVHLLTEQNNWMLRQLMAKNKLPLTGMPGE